MSSTDVLDVGRQHPFERLDYDPTPEEVVATLERAFGPVTVLQWPEGYKPPPCRVRLGGYPKRPRVPVGAVSVAYPSKWRNPYRPRKRSPKANAQAVERYREYLKRQPRLRAAAARSWPAGTSRAGARRICPAMPTCCWSWPTPSRGGSEHE